jgi:signal transduction histidine kinase
MNAPSDLALETSALKQSVFAGVLLWFTSGALCVAALFLVQGLRGTMPSANLSLGVALIALFPIFVPLLRWLGYPRTATGFLAYLLLVCTYVQCERGLTPGVALAMVTFLCLSGLFFGMQGARWAFAAALLSLGASALVSVNPFAARWEREFWDPHNPLVWLRYAAVLFFFGGSVLSAFTKLNDGYAEMRARLAATLERERNERRQRERAEEALEHARRLETLAQYAGGLAHDFNNNLMVIVGGSVLIAEDDQANERIRAMARDIQTSAEQGASMVHHLLGLGRKETLTPERVSAASLVQQCRGTLRRVLPSGVQLEFVIDEQAELMVDIAGLQQALLNLALNARDALGEQGMFTLAIARRLISELPSHTRARPGAFVVISCQDTGSGMDEATRSHLFEPFFTTKAAGKGTGLGLASVQRFVHDAGGFITVDSAPGVGTAFHLHFPPFGEGPHSDAAPPAQVELRTPGTL